MIDDTYKNNPVFKKTLEYSKFYELLSFSVFGFLTPGISGMISADSYVFSSVQGTLDSIHDVLLKGRINDAYALLRKYNDSVIINIYTILYCKDNLTEENYVVQKITNWINGTEKLPEYRIMSQYIRNHKTLIQLNDLIYINDTYKNLRERCNDNTHYNFYRNVLLNDKDIYNKNRLKELERFSTDIELLFLLHIAYLFYVNGHYMMSSDYRDSMDLGLEPEEGSQYYVAPFVQEVFDDVLKMRRPDIAKLIVENTAMQLT